MVKEIVGHGKIIFLGGADAVIPIIVFIHPQIWLFFVTGIIGVDETGVRVSPIYSSYAGVHTCVVCCCR